SAGRSCGVMRAARRFIQPMLERRRGSIINVCSSGILAHSHGGGYTALRPNSREMPYMASKAALATMCFYLADEVKAQNVAVNLILPGHTRTTGSDEQTRLRAAMGATNAPKMLVPEHVVPLVLYLASQDASQITGKLFDVVQWNLEHGLGDGSAGKYRSSAATMTFGQLLTIFIDPCPTPDYTQPDA